MKRGKEQDMLDKNMLKRFKIFTDAQEDALAAVAQFAEEISCEAGDTLYRAEDPSDRFYAVLEGDVQLELTFEEKILKPAIKYEEVDESRFEFLRRPIQVAVAGPGSVFGWSALLESRRRTLTASCRSDCRLVAFSADRLKSVFENEPQLGYAVMRRLCDLVYSHLEKRTAKLIEAWGQAFGTDKI
jgi:CRP-like cAMP-binding protein